MPNKTIYVSDADLPIFERAQQLAGGNLSATIAQALRRFVESQEAKSSDFHEITVKVGSVTYLQKRFIGRLLARGRVEGYEADMPEVDYSGVSQSDWKRDAHWRQAQRRLVYEVYQTVKGKLALYSRDMPNWYYSGSKHDYDEYDWNNWRGEYRLEVVETIEELRGRIPDELYQAAEQALKGEASEFLDI